jgi:hypothetical protein
MKTKLMKKFDKPPPTHLTTPPKIKMDYLKRIKYVVNNGGGYAREAESARARRGDLDD